MLTDEKLAVARLHLYFYANYRRPRLTIRGYVFFFVVVCLLFFFYATWYATHDMGEGDGEVNYTRGA